MAVKLILNSYVLALDVGDARIGLAVCSSVARLPRPIETINNDDTVLEALQVIMRRESAQTVVIGVPRNQEGLETPQSQKIREFGELLTKKLNISPTYVDESLSSKRADDYLKANPKSDAAQDSLAACFILEEFLGTIEVDEV